MTVVSDNFNRADAGTLGGSWTAIVGTWTIVSNQAECNDDDGGTGYYARYDTDVGGSDMYAEAVTNSTQTSGGSNAGPVVRMRSGATTSYQFTTNLNDSCAFWRVVAGAETQIATFTAAVAAGDTLRLEAIGATLRAKVNGAIVAFTQDTNISDGQRGGLNGYNNVGTDVVRVNDFEAGRITDDPPGGAYVVNWGIHSEGVITPRTPDLPTNPTVAAGDLILVPCVVRDDTQTISPDGTEGWSTIQTATQTGLKQTLFAKVWGLGGQTDDNSPEFSVTSATAGFGLVPVIVRNPQHTTAPWTSVASAIVASGQQSNAASATATAPSVSYTGTHATVMRFFSSADDNALGAPSTGALVFGGANYDTASGNDFSQACSVQEDITVTTSTGTSTVTETINGNDVSNGITIVIAIPAASVNASAANAPGAGTANQAAAAPAPTAGLASAAGAAHAATSNVGPHPGSATAAGSANPATILTGSAPQPAAPAGTGSANAASAAVAASAGLAAGTGTAGQASPSIAPGAGPAAATGTAPPAAAQTGSFTNATAGTAAAAGQANTPASLVASSSGLAASAGTAHPAAARVSVSAGVATGAGAALGAVGAVHKPVFAGLADALGEASAARTPIAVGAGVAAAAGSAGGADVDATVPFIDPNPTIGRVRESNPTLTDSRVQRLRESR